MDDKLLNLLGLASKAGYLSKGTDTVINDLQHNKIQIVFVAKDSSEKTIDNFKRKCYFYHVPLCLNYTNSELSASIGANRCVIGVKNKEMYRGMAKYLKGEENES